MLWKNLHLVVKLQYFPVFPWYKHIYWLQFPHFPGFPKLCVYEPWVDIMLPMRDDWEPFKQGTISRFLVPTSDCRYHWVLQYRTVFGDGFKEVQGFGFGQVRIEYKDKALIKCIRTQTTKETQIHVLWLETGGSYFIKHPHDQTSGGIMNN